MNPSRRTAAAAVRRSARNAGIMASSNGRASAVPAPRRIVRRDKCLLVISTVGLLLGCLPHLKGNTLNDTRDQIGETVSLRLGDSHHFTNGRLIPSVQLAA